MEQHSSSSWMLRTMLQEHFMAAFTLLQPMSDSNGGSYICKFMAYESCDGKL
jgi:hypothetical protein